jgi:hypothetical protein
MFLDEMSGKMAKDHAIEIAKHHRIQASPGFHDAVVYVQEELKKIGLDNAVIEKFPADGKTKYWTYDAIISWKVNSGEIRMIEPVDELLGCYDELAMSLATHSKSTDIIAEVVDVGSGVEDSDYKGKDVKGKMALVSGQARTNHLKAIEHGAIGTIHHPVWDRAAGYPDLVRYNGIWPRQETRDKTTFGFSISDRQYQKIKKLLDEGKKIKVHCKVDAELYDGFSEILTAVFTGTEKPEEETILIAHLCHPKTCTNDNASGSGVLVEIARSMKALIDAGKMEPPKRTIRFMWVPEINGTVAWMHGHQDVLSKVHVSINLDMVGQHPVTVGWPLNLVSAPDSTPSYLNPLLSNLLKEVADDRRGTAIEGWKYGLNYRVEGFAGGSDHLLFSDASFGIPSVMFYNPDHFHHTTFDDASRMDSTKMKKVGVVAGAASLTIANADLKTVLELASLTSAYGIRRIGENTTRTLSKLIALEGSFLGSELSRRLGTAYLRGVKMIDEASTREIKAIESAMALSDDDPAKLERFKQEIFDLAKTEKSKLRDIYEELCRKNNVKKMRKERRKRIVETKSLIPKRTFEGPARSLRPWHIKDDKDKKWLSEFNAKHNPHRNYFATLGGARHEIMNFVDGERSVYDIAMAVSTEYDDIEPEEVKRFLDICKSAEKVTYL